MDLWVRSQDKLTLTKINSIGIEYDKKLVGYGEICVKLGEYKTKERALEVLDEIHQRLLNLQYLDTVGADYIPLKMKEDGIDVVYIMPEK